MLEEEILCFETLLTKGFKCCSPKKIKCNFVKSYAIDLTKSPMEVQDAYL
jgi:hypothetical protein